MNSAAQHGVPQHFCPDFSLCLAGRSPAPDSFASPVRWTLANCWGTSVLHPTRSNLLVVGEVWTSTASHFKTRELGVRCPCSLFSWQNYERILLFVWVCFSQRNSVVFLMSSDFLSPTCCASLLLFPHIQKHGFGPYCYDCSIFFPAFYLLLLFQ